MYVSFISQWGQKTCINYLLHNSLMTAIASLSWFALWNTHFIDLSICTIETTETWKLFAIGRCWTAIIFYHLRPNERHYSSLQRLRLSCSILWLRSLIFFGKKTMHWCWDPIKWMIKCPKVFSCIIQHPISVCWGNDCI